MSKSFGLWNSRLLSVSRSEQQLLHYGKCSIQVVLDISFSAAVLDRMIIISSHLLNLVLLQIHRRTCQTISNKKQQFGHQRALMSSQNSVNFVYHLILKNQMINSPKYRYQTWVSIQSMLISCWIGQWSTMLLINLTDWLVSNQPISELVWLPSTQTAKARGELKYSVLRLLIFMYIHCREHFFWKWTITDGKGHRCAEVVHYGSGIIAFLTLVPIVMKSWRCPDAEWQITPRFNHTSVGAVGLVGGWSVGVMPLLEGGQLAFVKKRVAADHSYHFPSS